MVALTYCFSFSSVRLLVIAGPWSPLTIHNWGYQNLDGLVLQPGSIV